MPGFKISSHLWSLCKSFGFIYDGSRDLTMTLLFNLQGDLCIIINMCYNYFSSKQIMWSCTHLLLPMGTRCKVMCTRQIMYHNVLFSYRCMMCENMYSCLLWLLWGLIIYLNTSPALPESQNHIDISSYFPCAFCQPDISLFLTLDVKP